jgi:hypothetical protein
LANSWLRFDPKYLEVEYQASLWRNHIEDHAFEFRFLEELLPDLEAKLSDEKYYENQPKKFDMGIVKKQYEEYTKKLREK